jgi:ferredoxin--NADP+ reductase
MEIHPGYFVVIIGGGVAGSEAAYQLSKRGIYSAIFEQHALPYGKIEEGLPKWHIKLRNQEEKKIDDKLSQSHVFLIPKTTIGTDISLKEILEWGFSAIILASGAWRDRPLPLPDINRYIGKGLYYQNMFVSWFNHYHEPGFSAPDCPIHDNAIVIGGGLASLDVVKILMLETTLQALAERGYKANLFELERFGINDYLKNNGISFSDLGLKGCTLYYRKRVEDMPITPLPPTLSPEKLVKIQQLRKRIIQKYQDKYLFDVKECYLPIRAIDDDGWLKGIVFRKVNQLPRKAHYEIEVRSSLVISAIGSLPTVFPEISRQGELLAIADPKTGRIKGYQNVFAIGNAITGRGNIQESLTSSRYISRLLMEDYLDWRAEEIQMLLKKDITDSAKTVTRIEKKLKSKKLLSVKKIQELLYKIYKRQQVIGYNGNYREWISRNLPIRLEDMR